MPLGTKIKPEEIISKLREAEVEWARGKKVPEACKQIGVTAQTYYRWKKECGGLRMDQAKLCTCRGCGVHYKICEETPDSGLEVIWPVRMTP